MTDAARKIRLLIVDDIVETRNNMINLLYFEKDIEVVGAASNGREAIEQAKKLEPDIILMDINMPDMDGITATERIRMQIPNTAVIMMSVQGEQDYLRRAMLAGAREFLIKPFSSDDLVASIRQVYQLEQSRPRMMASATPEASAKDEGPQGEIISIFSPKGGVGRTTILVNLATALKQTAPDKKVALVDGSLFFGDVSVMLNLLPTKTINDLVGRADQLDAQLLDDVLLTHSSGVRVLLAPPRPQQAELVDANDFKKILIELRRNYDYVFVDTYPSLNQEAVLSALDVSDLILTVMTLEMPAIKDMRLFLEVAELLEYSTDKIALVVNRADSKQGIRVENIESSIRHPVAASIISSGVDVTLSINQGVPLVISKPDNPFSKDIFTMAKRIMDGSITVPERTLQANAKDKNAKTSPQAGVAGKNGKQPPTSVVAAPKPRRSGLFGFLSRSA